MPNAPARAPMAAPSDDPAARRRELLAVLAICAAQARGERERALCDRWLCRRRVGDPRLAVMRDS